MRPQRPRICAAGAGTHNELSQSSAAPCGLGFDNKSGGARMFDAELEYGLDQDFGRGPLAIRRLSHTRTVEIAGDCADVTFFVVDDQGRREAARKLLNGRYGWRGYGSAHDLGSDRHHTTFAAEIDGEIVGTMTLAIDSPDGLAIDRTFRDVAADARREPGTRICELTKLAFDEGVRSKEVLAGLFHMAFIYGTMLSDCTDLFIEVNPRHVRFYQTMLGFRSVGGECLNLSVGAPSRLMRLAVDEIGRNIRQMTENPTSGNARSLYPYFFPAPEERQVRRQLEFAFSAAAGFEQYLDPAAQIIPALADRGCVAGARSALLPARM